MKEELQNHFSPEFRNRLTNIFYFNNLDDKSMKLIVDKNIRRINECLKEKRVNVSVTDEANDWIVSEAMKENSGGRPVERIVDSQISEKISEEILFGKLVNGGSVTAELNKDKTGLELKF